MLAVNFATVSLIATRGPADDQRWPHAVGIRTGKLQRERAPLTRKSTRRIKSLRIYTRPTTHAPDIHASTGQRVKILKKGTGTSATYK